MNREQYRRARRILKNDCALTEQYYDPRTGETCAVGALFREAGVDLTEIAAKRLNKKGIGHHTLMPYLPHMKKAFGLERSDLLRLQYANDSVCRFGRRGSVEWNKNHATRRAKVLDALDRAYTLHKYARDAARDVKRAAKQLASA